MRSDFIAIDCWGFGVVSLMQGHKVTWSPVSGPQVRTFGRGCLLIQVVVYVLQKTSRSG